MDSTAILARNLRRLRTLRGFSQEALADAAGIDRSYLSDIERERSAATIDKLDALARALDVLPKDLIDEAADFAPRNA